MTPPAYSTASAFRQALEARLHSMAQGHSADIQRMRRQVAFDRFLCRIFQCSGEYWLLKGGYAMELRLRESRTTRDIDLAVRRAIDGSGPLQNRMLHRLQAAASMDLKDFFVFAVGRPSQDLANVPYGGARFPVQARMAGRTFSRFHLDVAAGEPVLEPIEIVQGGDWLAFAGIPADGFPSISKEQQFAEKLHAYTLPRTDRPNTRVRDLLDMLLLVRAGMRNDLLLEAVRIVFARRNTHPVPIALPSPPVSWTNPFAAMAGECGIDADVNEVLRVVAAYLSKKNVLA